MLALISSSWRRDVIRLSRTPLRLLSPLIAPLLLLLSVGLGLVGSDSPDAARVVSGLAFMSCFLYGGTQGMDVFQDTDPGVSLDLAGSSRRAAYTIIARCGLSGMLGAGSGSIIWLLGGAGGLPLPGSALRYLTSVICLFLIGVVSSCWAILLAFSVRSVASLGGLLNIVYNALFFIGGTIYDPAKAVRLLEVSTYCNPAFYWGELLREVSTGQLELLTLTICILILVLSVALVYFRATKILPKRYQWS